MAVRRNIFVFCVFKDVVDSAQHNYNVKQFAGTMFYDVLICLHGKD